MATGTVLEEGLRDNDVFDVFIDLLNSEKDKKKGFLIDFDRIIADIATIKDILEARTYSTVIEFKVLDLQDFRNIITPLSFEVYYNTNLDSHQVIGTDIQSMSVETIDMLLQYNVGNINFHRGRVNNAYIRNCIILILEKYLHFYETFGFIRDESFNKDFSNYIRYLKIILKKIDTTFNEKITKLLNQLYSILEPFDQGKYSKTRMNSEVFAIRNFINDVVNSDIFYLTREVVENNFRNDKRLQNLLLTDIDQEALDFDLSITVDTNDKDQSKLFLALFLIMKSIDNVDGVEIEIIDVKKGSLTSKIKVKLKDIVAKEEVKTVLRNGVEIAGKMLTDTSISETNKNYAETEKTKLETEELSNQIAASLPLEDQKRKNRLALQRDKLENKKLQSEINLLKQDEEIKNIELKTKKLEYLQKLSDLFAKGILEADMIEISLDGIPILIKKDGRLEIGNVDQALLG